MKFKTAIALSLLTSLLLACTTKEAPQPKSEDQATPNNTALPASAPRVGTSIQSMLKPPDSQLAQLKAQYNAYTRIEWSDLTLPGQRAEDIVKKYKAQIDSIPEGDPSEKGVLAKMRQELNAAPVNPAMNGKKIKLPGFVTPLEIDDKNAMIKEFLLVPNFGSCIHIPPPPLNNTILVKPLVGRSIGMERVYEPVWVYGTLSTDTAHTDLADAGYQLLEAKVEMYEVDKQE